MYAWKSIQKVVDYIEDNIAGSHSAEELAKVAALSPFYFQRLFTRLVKRPVNEYIKMRRLARACETLADKNRRILDIALDYGFSSHESFTKAFKGAFHITPEEYRANPVPLNQVIKPELLLNYAMMDENVPLITDEVVIEITRRVLPETERYIGFSGQVPIEGQIPLGEATGIDVPGLLWDKFHDAKADIQGLAPGGIEFAVSFDGKLENHFTYFVGASAIAGAKGSGGLEVWELQAGEYVVCTLEAENFKELVSNALYKSMNFLFGTWLPKHGLTTLPFSAEKYYAADLDAAKMEIWVRCVPAGE